MMHALSLRQPWAFAVLHLGKSIENRTWPTKFRGEFLIHAALGMTPQEYEDAEDFIAETLGWDQPGASGIAKIARMGYDFREHDKRGGIVGRARLVDVLAPCATQPSAAAGLFGSLPCGHKWHIPEQYGFVLEDVKAVPFVPCRGSLGFFRVPDDVERAVAGGAA